MSSNPLLSSTNTSDSGLHASLHPLVLLTISDYITRHTLRKLTTPIVGALIGQQNGREITIEHAYDVKLVSPDEADTAGQWQLNESWFEERLQQYKDVHKAPALDLVGWWTVSPSNGPGQEVLQIHHQVLKQNESALLLTFHPEAILSGNASGGKLPLTIYESVHENVGTGDSGEAMQVEGEESSNEKLDMRLKELRYEIVTGEAEMISVDFVARGGGNATAIESTVNPHATTAPESKSKGKDKQSEEASEDLHLNSEEEELIAFLTSRANAIKMLDARLSLLKQHLDSLPASYINTDDLTSSTANSKISHPILRAILALATKLPLILPSDTAAFEQEQATERSDVALVQLMGDIGRSIQSAKELGSKFSIAENNKKNDKGLVSLGAGGWADIDTGMSMDSNLDVGYPSL